MSANKPSVLIFSAHDPSCGAGMAADILTISDIGVQALSALTAITVQDSQGVYQIHPLPAELITSQAEVILADLVVPPVVCKIGVVASKENLIAITKILHNNPQMLVVIDPVLSSGRGDSFANQELIASLCKDLLPLATIITPNSLEAEKLTNYLSSKNSNLSINKNEKNVDSNLLESEKKLHLYAQIILATGCKNILITGGHNLEQNVINRFYTNNSSTREKLEQSQISWRRLNEQYHGSGCRLASAIAAYLASGLQLNEAVNLAQSHTYRTLIRSQQFGVGQFIPQNN